MENNDNFGDEINSPGNEFYSRPLHFIWILDCSGSMKQKGKIETLNNAIREAIPKTLAVSEENPRAQLLVRTITFSNEAKWLNNGKPIKIKDFKWEDVTAYGETYLGKAFQLLTEALKMPPMEPKALPPVLVLISDGRPTDDYKPGLKALLEQQWGKKAVRISIAIGHEAEKGVLHEFMGGGDLKPLQADNANELTKLIRWVSTRVVEAASTPAGTGSDEKPKISIPAEFIAKEKSIPASTSAAGNANTPPPIENQGKENMPEKGDDDAIW